MENDSTFIIFSELDAGFINFEEVNIATTTLYRQNFN